MWLVLAIADMLDWRRLLSRPHYLLIDRGMGTMVVGIGPFLEDTVAKNRCLAPFSITATDVDDWR